MENELENIIKNFKSSGTAVCPLTNSGQITLSFPTRKNIRMTEIQEFHKEGSRPSKKRFAALMRTKCTEQHAQG